MSDPPLLHLVGADAWAAAQRLGHVRPPSLDEVGFVHLCTPDQVEVVVGRHYPDATDLLVLVLDPAALDDVRWDESHPGEHYPHLYRPLPVTAVTAVLPWPPPPDHTWAHS